MKKVLSGWAVDHMNKGVLAMRKDKKRAQLVMEQMIRDSAGQVLWLSVEPIYKWVKE